MSTDINRTIDPNEQHLNNLFKEVLDGLRDDIFEAQANVDMYAAAISVDGGKDLYGTLYNDSLRVKGSARDRLLKFLTTFKERVTRKEEVEFKKEQKQQDKQASQTGGLNISDMNKVIEEMAKAGKLENIQLDFSDDEEDDDE